MDTVHIQTLFWALAIIGTEVQIPMRVIASLGQHAEKVSQSRELSPPFFFLVSSFFFNYLLTIRMRRGVDGLTDQKKTYDLCDRSHRGWSLRQVTQLD